MPLNNEKSDGHLAHLVETAEREGGSHMSWFKMFNKYDADGTGRIDFDEVRCAARDRDRDREAARSIGMVYIYMNLDVVYRLRRGTHTPARARGRAIDRCNTWVQLRDRARAIDRYNI